MIRIGMLLLAAVALAAGCSSANSPGEGNGGTSAYHVDASGRSIPEWVVPPAGGSHASTAALVYADTGGVDSCAECHGTDLSGGISKVSCFANAAGCHHGSVTGWAAPDIHGASAKQAPGSSGFRTCQICHGQGYSGGGSGVSCFDCHTVDAPHAQAPWRGTGATHVDTDGGNAAVCAQCHFAGSPINPGGHPFEPAEAGAEPGCFNNTLCHGFYAQ